LGFVFTRNDGSATVGVVVFVTKGLGLPKTMLRQSITNPSTNEAIEIYLADSNYPKIYRNFLIKSDNGRSSLRIPNTFSLKVASVEFEAIDNNIRLHLEQKMPLISVEEPLPPRVGMQ
jgi:hypothetical protein